MHLWWREGNFVDHMLGKPGISETVRNKPTVEERERVVPEDVRVGLLQLKVGGAGQFPSTLFVHGNEDTMRLPAESECLHRKILQSGAKSQPLLVPSVGHGLVNEDDFWKQKDPFETGLEARKALAQVETWLIDILN